MSATASLNGKPRPQLSDQLDRLDGILDVLGEGLTAAVADAMKAGTALAVKEALVEILTNPELLAAVRGTLPRTGSVPGEVTNSTPARPGLGARLNAKMAAARTATVAAVAKTKERLVAAGTSVRAGVTHSVLTLLGRVGALRRHVVAGVRVARFVTRLKQITLIAVGIGTATGMMSLLAPHAFAALTSGLTAAVTIVGVQLGLRTRSLWRRVLPALT
jgi:hypothetical protein